MTRTVLAAEAFTASPAGWVIITLVGVLIAGGAYWFKRQDSRLEALQAAATEAQEAQNRRMSRIEEGLTAAVQGLAVLVQQSTDESKIIAAVPGLERSVAVLLDRLERHERWAENEHNNARQDRAARLTGASPRPHPPAHR